MTHYRNLLSNRPIVGVLALSSTASLLLLFLRWLLPRVDQHYHMMYLSWDLFLAWLPLIFSSAVRALHESHSQNRRLIYALAVLWLLLLPNSPYLVTEFTHLGPSRELGYWYDELMIMMFAWQGLLLGLLSLHDIHLVARERFGMRVGNCTAIIAMALCSYGVSLGRFRRFNSWDFLHPARVLGTMVWQVRHPTMFAKGFLMTAILFGFLSLAYLAIEVMLRPSPLRHPGKRTRDFRDANV